MSFARTRSTTFAISRSTILTRSLRSSWWKTIMSSNRFKNSGLNTRFDSSRIFSRIASYDPCASIRGKRLRKVYVDDQDIDYDLCRETAPANFTRIDDGGYSYVFKQPTTPEEEALCKEAMEGCPVEAIGNDGEG